MPGLIDLHLNEARYGRQQYINAKPTVITLQPTRDGVNPVAKPGGGHDFPKPAARAPQTFRLVAQPSEPVEHGAHDDGFTRKVEYMLVGAYDAIVEIGDTWDEGDFHFHVDSLQPYNGYEVRANVTGFAVKPNA